jgi:hypothetical protein
VALVSPNTIDTTLVQDGRAAASITPAVIRQIVDSLAGVFIPAPQTATYTVALSDRGCMIEFNTSSAVTLQIPTNASVAFDVGTVIGWYQAGTGTVTIAAVSTGTTAVRTSASLQARAQYSQGIIRKRATDEWVVSGDLL